MDDTAVLDKPKRGKRVEATVTEWEPKVGRSCLYWMTSGSGQLVPYAAVVVGKCLEVEDRWKLVRFQAIRGAAAMPVMQAIFGTEPAHGTFTPPE